MNGIIVINKEKGFTSFDVVKIVRGKVGEKHLGHTGTLDPNATGVLPVCIGSCTRLIEYMDSAPKKYIATARFGITTDSQDVWGTVLEEKEYTGISKEILLKTISHYIGTIIQTPSIYSAVRVNGRHLYNYAHGGEKVEIPQRTVEVYSIDLLSFDEKEGVFTMEVSCGRGTYVRTICNDIGKELGFGAVLTALERTSACGFSLSDAVKIGELREMPRKRIEQLLKPAESAVSFMNRIDISEEEKKDFANGKHLKADQNGMSFEEPVCVFCDGVLCGVGKWDNPNRMRPIKVFVR